MAAKPIPSYSGGKDPGTVARQAASLLRLGPATENEVAQALGITVERLRECLKGDPRFKNSASGERILEIAARPPIREEKSEEETGEQIGERTQEEDQSDDDPDWEPGFDVNRPGTTWDSIG